MSQYHVNNISAQESPINHMHAYAIQLTHGNYVKDVVASHFSYKTAEQALEAGQQAALTYQATGHFPALH